MASPITLRTNPIYIHIYFFNSINWLRPFLIQTFNFRVNFSIESVCLLLCLIDLDGQFKTAIFLVMRSCLGVTA